MHGIFNKTCAHHLSEMINKKPFQISYFSTISSFKIISAHSICELSNLCSKGYLKQAFETFKFEIWMNPQLFSHLIHGCVSTKCISLAKQLHALTITSGCFQDKFVTNHLMNMYGKLGDLNSMLFLYNVMPRKNLMSANILINGYLGNGDLESARKLFDEMPERNVATWNSMVNGMMQFKENEEGLRFFSGMQREGFSPDEFALGSMLRGCAGLRALLCGRQVHGYTVKSGYEVSSIVGNALANMYMRCKSLEEGGRVIREMPVQDAVSFNTFIAGMAQNMCPEAALQHYNLMKKRGLQPNQITFGSVLRSCSELATLGQGQQIHAEVIKRGDTLVEGVVSSLISMYSKCGCLEDSIKSFTKRKDEDIVLWTSMIAAYGFHGKGEKVIEFFDQIEGQGLKPNEVTFLSLLYACSHCGLKDKGLEFLDLMVSKYGLSPGVEHYTCIVDLLGRSGCLSKAEEMIRTMPVKADPVIWKVLLSACKMHKNADMAMRISQEVVKLGALDAASYVLLANIQASAKRWEEVSTMRKAMKDLRVKKEPGVSWFEFRNKVYQFTMDAKIHPRWKEINSYVKELMSEIKKCGYQPDTDSVLQDMGQDEKEESLAHHSEKLAIAFALMISPPDFPIRIMKNLRICSDCHVAIKYIAKIKEREIIVRDASRFHYFKDGTCSCGEFW